MSHEETLTTSFHQGANLDDQPFLFLIRSPSYLPERSFLPTSSISSSSAATHSLMSQLEQANPKAPTATLPISTPPSHLATYLPDYRAASDLSLLFHSFIHSSILQLSLLDGPGVAPTTYANLLPSSLFPSKLIRPRLSRVSRSHHLASVSNQRTRLVRCHGSRVKAVCPRMGRPQRYVIFALLLAASLPSLERLRRFCTVARAHPLPFHFIASVLYLATTNGAF